MATSQVLQKPKIIEIVGSTIRVAHPTISNNVRSYLSAPIVAAGTGMTVLDNHGFADNDWMVVGEIGDEQTETTDVNGAVTRGTSMTVTNYLSFDHEINAPVTKINERGIKIYGAATDGGAGTIIESIDAIAASGRQLADAKMIEWNKPYTEYTLISTDTSYAYYYVVFTDGVTDSSASDYVAAGGVSSSSVEYMINQALDLTNSKIGHNGITREMCVRWANDCQREISQFTYQDPLTGQFMQKDWGFEITEDVTSLTVSENENEYALSSLSVAAKYADMDKAIISIRLGDKKPMDKITIDEFDDVLEGKRRTETSVVANSGDTTLTVDSNVEFSDSGALYVGSDQITYTGKSGTTQFTGIPASGAGSITTTHAVDSPVWQNVAPAEPLMYVIYDGNIKFTVPVDGDFANYKIKARYFKKLTDLTETSDTTDIPFTNVFQYYIGSKIMQRKGNDQRAQLLMNKWFETVRSNALADLIPTTDEHTYYEFDSSPGDYDVY